MGSYERLSPEARRVVDAATRGACDVAREYDGRGMGDLGFIPLIFAAVSAAGAVAGAKVQADHQKAMAKLQAEHEERMLAIERQAQQEFEERMKAEQDAALAAQQAAYARQGYVTEATGDYATIAEAEGVNWKSFILPAGIAAGALALTALS
jgi:uncharacterized protein HemX